MDVDVLRVNYIIINCTFSLTYNIIDPQYIIIAYVLGPVGGIVLVVLIIAGFIIIYWKKNKSM